jgi:hypothetical protein
MIQTQRAMMPYRLQKDKRLKRRRGRRRRDEREKRRLNSSSWTIPQPCVYDDAFSQRQADCALSQRPCIC